MAIINTEVVGGKRVVFEPGNATRYDFSIILTQQYGLVAIDHNNLRVVHLPKNRDAASFRVAFEKAGYSNSDVSAIVLYLLEEVENNAYVTYKVIHEDGYTELRTRWFKEDAWGDNYEDVMTKGYEIVEQGMLLW